MMVALAGFEADAGPVDPAVVACALPSTCACCRASGADGPTPKGGPSGAVWRPLGWRRFAGHLERPRSCWRRAASALERGVSHPLAPRSGRAPASIVRVPAPGGAAPDATHLRPVRAGSCRQQTSRAVPAVAAHLLCASGARPRPPRMGERRPHLIGDHLRRSSDGAGSTLLGQTPAVRWRPGLDRARWTRATINRRLAEACTVRGGPPSAPPGRVAPFAPRRPVGRGARVKRRGRRCLASRRRPAPGRRVLAIA